MVAWGVSGCNNDSNGTYIIMEIMQWIVHVELWSTNGNSRACVLTATTQWIARVELWRGIDSSGGCSHRVTILRLNVRQVACKAKLGSTSVATINGVSCYSIALNIVILTIHCSCHA